MENRKGTRTKKRPSQIPAIFHFLFSSFLLSAGCGAPGEPIPPAPPVPVAIKDLGARQAGDGVLLSFTLPSNTVTGAKLATPPAVEILRGSVRPDGSADAKSFQVVYTVPSALIENYRLDGRVAFTDPIAPDETKSHPGSAVAYAVRTRASQKRASADSNVVTLRVFPVPAPIANVEARVTESAIELSWAAPTTTTAGEPIAIADFKIYRSDARAASMSPDSQTPQRVEAKPEVHPTLLATSETNSFSDATMVFDHTYVYIVRSVILADGNELESSDSPPVTVTPRDTFPPGTPQALVAAVLPGEGTAKLVVDLSWSINLETDLAGYHVYRSEQEGTRGQLVTPDLLPTPAARDNSVQPGHRYWYTVTAVDRAGNESPPCVPVAVDVTQASP